MTTYRTKTGKLMTEADLDALAADVLAADYDPNVALPKVGRPRMGSAPADVAHVRLEPELRAALEERVARGEGESLSDVIRIALRAYLFAA